MCLQRIEARLNRSYLAHGTFSSKNYRQAYLFYDLGVRKVASSTKIRLLLSRVSTCEASINSTVRNEMSCRGGGFASMSLRNQQELLMPMAPSFLSR